GLAAQARAPSLPVDAHQWPPATEASTPAYRSLHQTDVSGRTVQAAAETHPAVRPPGVPRLADAPALRSVDLPQLCFPPRASTRQCRRHPPPSLRRTWYPGSATISA